jgi:hypothetical protein
MGRSSPRMALASPTSEDLVDRTPRVRVRPCHVGRRARVAVASPWAMGSCVGVPWRVPCNLGAARALPFSEDCIAFSDQIYYFTSTLVPTSRISYYTLQEFVLYHLRGLHISAPLQVHMCAVPRARRTARASAQTTPQSPRPTRTRHTLPSAQPRRGLCSLGCLRRGYASPKFKRARSESEHKGGKRVT